MQHKTGLSLNVRGQVLSLFAISTFLLLAAALFGYLQFSNSLRVYDQDVMPDQRNAIDIESVEVSFKMQVQEWKDVLLRGKKPEALDKHWGAFQKRETDVSDLAGRVSSNVEDAEAAKLVKQFIAAHKKMGEAYRQGLQQYKDHAFDSTAGDQAVAGMDRGPSELLTKARERLVQLAESRAKDAKEEERRSTPIIVAVFGLAVAIGGALFMIAVQRRVSRPLTTIVGALNKLGDGNFGVALPGLERSDEIGEIARSVERFKVKAEERTREEAEARANQDRAVSQQRQTLLLKMADEFEAAVGKVIETVASASNELEGSATTLTRTAETNQQLSDVVASASEEASTNVQAVATATEELSSSINEIGRRVQDSARIANEAVDQARITTERVSKLSEAAIRIGDVVELINSIAGQTNLLALNATIEAARAGEAGRGFAVVASEVKALAEQTARATGEIGQQITGIQAATQESVGAINEISTTIGRLSEISSAIAAAVEEQGAATQEIARNVQQAAQGTQAVSSNVGEVQRGTGETGQASSMVLSSARALTAESGKLKMEMNKFLTTVRAA